MALYENSRVSFRELGRKLNISHNTIATVIKNCQEKYSLVYTLELSEQALGFSEGRLITIKFEKIPDIGLLKEKFQKDSFVQDAYLASGDFDLLLYVVGLTAQDFQSWQFNLRKNFHDYGPLLKTSTVSYHTVGFFPLRNEIIMESAVLNNTDKRILALLNGDSRMKLKELIKKGNTTQMRVIYTVKKLKEKGIIRRFSALTQNPEKKLFLAYGALLTPIKEHSKLSLSLAAEYIKENLHEVTNECCLVVDANGAYDTFYICTFENGEMMAKRGPSLLKTLWAEENPKIESALLTGIIVGKWPFHLEEYRTYKEFVKAQTND
jgi:DNA-binding Lrp family transcriptional regulator